MRSWYMYIFCVSCGEAVAAVRDPETPDSSSLYTYECHACGYCGLLERPVDRPVDDSQHRGTGSGPA